MPRTRFNNLQGKKINKFTVLRLANKDEIPSVTRFGNKYNNSYTWWWCKCDCGNYKAMYTGNILSKTVKSCGCVLSQRNAVSPLRKPFSEAAKLGAYNSYKRGAMWRGYEWELSLEDFLRLTSAPCHYCGTEWSVESGVNCYGSYKRNGIDRVDNNVGYKLSNCVTACKNCNHIKGTKDLTEWQDVLVWANKLARMNPK